MLHAHNYHIILTALQYLTADLLWIRTLAATEHEGDLLIGSVHCPGEL